MTMMFEGDFENFEFDQSQLEIILSYKKYFKLFKRDDRAYWGIFNRNVFLLSRDDAYYTKIEELFGSQRTRARGFNNLILGPTIGLAIPLGDHLRFELGIGLGIDLLDSFGEFGGLTFDEHLPILIGYKF